MRTFRVAVEVNANSNTQTQATSIINRELRKLQGVTLVDASPEYRISLLFLDTKNMAQAHIGHVIAVLVTRPLNDFYLELLAKDKMTPENYKTLREYTMLGVEVKLYEVVTGGPDELDKLLAGVAADIDVDCLEKDRKFWQRLVDAEKTRKTK